MPCRHFSSYLLLKIMKQISRKAVFLMPIIISLSRSSCPKVAISTVKSRQSVSRSRVICICHHLRIVVKLTDVNAPAGRHTWLSVPKTRTGVRKSSGSVNLHFIQSLVFLSSCLRDCSSEHVLLGLNAKIFFKMCLLPHLPC